MMVEKMLYSTIPILHNIYYTTLMCIIVAMPIIKAFKYHHRAFLFVFIHIDFGITILE